MTFADGVGQLFAPNQQCCLWAGKVTGDQGRVVRSGMFLLWF